MQNQPKNQMLDVAVETLLRELRDEILKATAAVGQGYGGTSLIMAGQLGLLMVFHPSIKATKALLNTCHDAVRATLTEHNGEPTEVTTREVDAIAEPDAQPGRN